MLINGPNGIKMEEFTYGKYTHRFVVDMKESTGYRQANRDYEMQKFWKYIQEHKAGMVLA